MSSQRQSFWKKQQCKLQRRAAGNVPYALPVKDENSEELVVSPGGKVEEDTSSDSCVGESESLKPRLVQCPKCQAILPEPESASPYFQCGGCSTVLQAKHGSSAPPLSRQSSAPTPPSNSKEGAHHERRRDSWSLLGVRGSSLPTSLRTKRMSSEEPRATGPKVAVELKRQSLEQLRIVDLATCSDTASSSVAAPELLETEIFQKSGDCSSTNTPALLERSGVPTTHVNAPSMRDDGEAGTSSHLLFLEAAKEMDVDMPRISASDEESGMEVTVFQGKGSEDSGTSVISPGGCEEVVRMLRISDSEDEAEDAVVGDAKVASSGLARDREVLGEAGSSCTVEVGAADEPDRIEEHRRLADVSSIGDGGDLQLCSVDLMPLADGEPGDDGPADAKALSDVAGDVPVATHVLVGSEAALAKESSACASDASAQDSQSWVEPEELEPSASQYEQASVEHLALYSGSAVSQASAHKSVGKEEDVDGALAPGRKERVLVGEGAHVDKPDVASPSGPSGEILAATMSQDLIVLAGEGPSTSARNLEGSDAGGLSRTVSEDEISLQQGEEKGSSRKMEGSGLSRTGSEEQFLRANEEKCSTRNVDGNGLSRTGSEEQFLQAGEQKGSSRNMDGSGLSRTGSEGFDSLPREFDVGSTLSSHNSRQSLEGDVYAPADVEEYVAVPASISQQEFLSDVSNWAAADIPRLLDVELAMPETAAPAAGMMGRKSREDFASDKDRSPSPNSVITVEVRPSPPDPSPTYPVPISPIERQLAVPFPTPIQSPRHTDAPPAGFEAHVLSVKSFSRKAQPPLEDPSIPPQSSSKVVRPTDSALLRVMEDERSTRAHARAGSEPDMLHLGQSLFEGEHDSGIAYGLGGGAGSDSDNEIPYAASALRGKAKRAGGGAPVGDVAAVPDYSPSKSARKVDGSDYPVPSMLPGSGMDALDPTSTGSMGGAAASSDAGSGDWQRSASRLEPPRRLFDRRRAAAIVLESNGDMETALSLLTAEIEGRRDSLYVDDDNYSEYSAASSSRGMGESVEAVKGPSGSKRAQQQEQQQHQPRPGIDRDRAAALLRNAGGDMEAALALLTVEIESGTVAPFAATPGPPAPLPTSSTSPPVQPLGTVPVPAFVPAAPTAGSGARGSRSKGSHKGEKKHGDGGGHAHGHGHGHGHGPWQKKLPGGEESSPSPPQSPIVRFFGLGMHAHAHAHAHAPAGEVAKGAGQPSAAPTKASSRRKSSLGRSKHEKKASVAIPTIPAVPESVGVPAVAGAGGMAGAASASGGGGKGAAEEAILAVEVPKKKTPSDSSFAELDELPRLPPAAYHASPQSNDPLPRLPPPTAAQVVPCQHCSHLLPVPPPNSKASGSLGFEIMRCNHCNMVSIFDRPAVPDLPLEPLESTSPPLEKDSRQQRQQLQQRHSTRPASVPVRRSFHHQPAASESWLEQPGSARRAKGHKREQSLDVNSGRLSAERRIGTHRRRMSDNFDASAKSTHRGASWDVAGTIPRFAQTPLPSYMQRRRAAQRGDVSFDSFRRIDSDFFVLDEEGAPANLSRRASYDGASGMLDLRARPVHVGGKGEPLSLSESHFSLPSSLSNPFSMLGRSIKKMAERQKAIKEAKVYGRRVVVNGKKIRDVEVEKAEKLAGPIHPGSYWYDPQAGFWGVTGGPCLGIITPGIPELSEALSRDCSSGDTAIVVNGRELHKKDLAVLVRRGLPRTRGARYTLDITGRISDETTGLRLKSLGRLAPSVEERGVGYGMYCPNDGDLRKSLEPVDRDEARRHPSASRR